MMMIDYGFDLWATSQQSPNAKFLKKRYLVRHFCTRRHWEKHEATELLVFA